MKRKIFTIASSPILFSSIIGLFGVGVAHAITPAPTLVTSFNGLADNVWCPVINVMFWVLIAISVIMVIWAAYLYVMSEGEAEKPSQARKMLLYAAIGIVVALAAKGFPDIIASVFNVSSTGTASFGACSG